MGNSKSRIEKLKKDIDEQKKIISQQKLFIDKQNRIIDLFKCKSVQDYCLRDGIVQKKDDDFINHIDTIKKNKKYKYIVLSGGGVKGLAFCGAMDVLSKYDALSDIKGYAGTSAGSIGASLLALGYTTDEIKDIMMDLDMNKIVDDKWGIVRDGVNFLTDWGLVPGNFLYDFLGDLIEKKTGNIDYTIDDLYNDKGIKLVIVATDMNTGSPLYFYPNHKDKAYQNISIRRAVRMSTGIPFMFEPIICNGNYCVDGGVLDNYPLHVFDGEYPGDINARLNAIPPNHEVIGLNIISGEEKISYNNITDRSNIDNIFEYLGSFITTLLADNQRKILLPSYWHRTININTPNYPGTKFNFTYEQKLGLVEDGQRAANDFFNKNED